MQAGRAFKVRTLHRVFLSSIQRFSCEPRPEPSIPISDATTAGDSDTDPYSEASDIRLRTCPDSPVDQTPATPHAPVERRAVRYFSVGYNRSTKLQKTNDFFNDGFGWMCKHCHREFEAQGYAYSRFFLEGEAESKQPELANSALAKWADAARTRLTCPRCAITELVEKA